MIDWGTEWPQIQDWSAKRGVDPLFIAAIRHTENGGDGKQFGVLGVGADTYQDQLRVATRTIAGLVAGYPANPFSAIMVEINGLKCLRYAPAFLKTVQQHWAPIGATNDPTNLNSNWLDNVTQAYTDFLAAGRPL